MFMTLHVTLKSQLYNNDFHIIFTLLAIASVMSQLSTVIKNTYKVVYAWTAFSMKLFNN